MNRNTHSVNPPFSAIIHGSEYHFPAGNCDQPDCHGTVLSGGTTGGISCTSCHDDLWRVFNDGTHTLNINGRYHNNLVESGNYMTSCTDATGNNKCHGNTGTLYPVNQTGKNYRFACYSCHNPIPGPDHKYLPPFSNVLHGKNFRFPFVDGNIPKCSTCHGATLTGGTSGEPDCHSCHIDLWSLYSTTHTLINGGYYHNAELSTPLLNNFATCASSSNCHNTALNGSPTGYPHACNSSICHSQIPHPNHTVSKDGTMHGWNVVNVSDFNSTNANTYCNINYCHGSTYRNGPLCTNCHD